MAHFDGPAKAHEITFGNDLVRGHLDAGKGRVHAIEKRFEFLGAFAGGLAFVDEAIGGEHFIDGFAASLVPDLLKPAEKRLLLVIGHKKTPPLPIARPYLRRYVIS